MKKALIIHPFLFGIFPVLFLFAHNIDQVLFQETLIPSAILMGLTFALLLLSRIIFKDSRKGAIVTSAFLMLFFSYGYIFNIIEARQIGDFVIGRHRYLLFACAVFFVCVVYFTKKAGELKNSTNILNATAAFLVLISLINIGAYKLDNSLHIRQNMTARNRQADAAVLKNPSIQRDIYYIILDSYVGSSALKRHYNYDNYEFTDYLTEKGFYVVSEGRSNYPGTTLSLASSLNMQYINYLSEIVGVDSKDQLVFYRRITDNKAMRFLKSKGYKFVHFNSGWAATRRNKFADWSFHCGRGSEFLMILIQTSMLDLPERHLGFMKGDLRKRILYAFDKLAEVHKIKGPTFTFAHLMVPHPPYVFGADGEPVPKAELQMHGDVWKRKENYLNQLIFVNKKVKVLVDEILSNSDIPPIIILQADHGTSTALHSLEKGVEEAIEHPTEEMLREKFCILNALYLPDGGADLLHESITPVNTFRVIFNFYFAADYELLDDQAYYSGSKRPRKFIDVTGKIGYN